MRLLIFAPAYERVADALGAMDAALEPVLLSPEGELSLHGERLENAEVDAEIAWASSDVFAGSVQTREFMISALKSKNLKWLQSGAAGFDHPIFRTLFDKGVALSKSNQAAVAISEYVMASVLECFQDVQARREAQQNGEWRRFSFREVAGGTWTIVGMGNIGCEVASRARAFGADVIGVRRNAGGDEPAERMITPAQLPEVLPESDVVVLCASSNADSQQLVNQEFLAAMKADAVLVNIARGALVDETALLAALDQGRPGWALLDVFETEPLPADSPLWRHPKVLATAHCAASSTGTEARGDAVFVENLQRYLAGEPLHHQVDGDALGEAVQGNKEN